MNKVFFSLIVICLFSFGCSNDSGKKIGSHSVANEDGFSQKQVISVAQYILDDGGFHGMDESINETSTINSSYQYTVGRISKVIDGAEWPKELETYASDFAITLGDFKTALATNSVAEAGVLATETHEAQHELSHHIDKWAGTITVAKTSPSVFAMAMFQYILDSAGFHGMDESLTNDKVIDFSYQYKVSRVKKVLENSIVPTELEDQTNDFIISLGSFHTALATSNVNDSIAYASEAHEAQHELSDEINAWLALQTKGSEVVVYNILLAQFVLDSAGFHGIQDTIEDEAAIDSSYAYKVDRARKVLSYTTWPTDLKVEAEAFVEKLDLFYTALKENNLANATSLSAEVHEAQHDLSHAIDEWVENQ